MPVTESSNDSLKMLPTNDSLMTHNDSFHMNGSSLNDSLHHLLDDGNFEFNMRLLLNVIAYSVMFVMGAIGNTLVLVAAHRQHVRYVYFHFRSHHSPFVAIQLNLFLHQ